MLNRPVIPTLLHQRPRAPIAAKVEVLKVELLKIERGEA